MKKSIYVIAFSLLFCLNATKIVAQIDESDFLEVDGDSMLVKLTLEQNPELITAYYSGNLSRIDSILAFSREYIGTPYRYGGTTPRGFDCSGFMSYVFERFGIKLPRRATHQYQSYSKVKRGDIMKGDLVFFSSRRRGKNIGHVGMVVDDIDENGDFRFIHSSTTRGVIISKSTEEYYANRYIGASRVIKVIKIDAEENHISPDLKQKTNTDTIIHIVTKGETLYSISHKYNVTIDSIDRMNSLNGKGINIGQELIVGVSKRELTNIKDEVNDKTKKAQAKKRHKTHTVKKGDNLYSIAKKYRTTVEKIRKDNSLKNNKLSVGQKLIIK